MSKAHQGKKLSLEHRQKIGEGQRGHKNQNWKGGRYKANGYVFVLRPDHPHANRQGYVREHRLVMEKALKRFLSPKEIVHHKNNVRDDNRLENLELFSGHSKHAASTGFWRKEIIRWQRAFYRATAMLLREREARALQEKKLRRAVRVEA